jgi:hypothetical protein
MILLLILIGMKKLRKEVVLTVVSTNQTKKEKHY